MILINHSVAKPQPKPFTAEDAEDAKVTKVVDVY